MIDLIYVVDEDNIYYDDCPATSVCLDKCCDEPCVDSDGNFICSATGEGCAENKGFFDMQKARKSMFDQAKEMSIE